MRTRKPDTAASPPGKRDALTGNFIAALQADWATHGEKVIADLRTSRPEIYSRMVADLVPRKLEVAASATEFEAMSEDEIESYLAESFSTNLAQAERIMAKARALAAARLGNGADDADPVVQIIDDTKLPAA